MAMAVRRLLSSSAQGLGRRGYADLKWFTEPTRPVGSSLPLAESRLVNIVAVDEDGRRHQVRGMAGQSLYRAFVHAGLRENIAHQTDALLACSGRVCRVSISDEWTPKLKPPVEYETYILSKHIIPPDEDPNVRCSCQIPLTHDLNGMVVALVPAKEWDLN